MCDLRQRHALKNFNSDGQGGGLWCPAGLLFEDATSTVFKITTPQVHLKKLYWCKIIEITLQFLENNKYPNHVSHPGILTPSVSKGVSTCWKESEKHFPYLVAFSFEITKSKW